MQLRAVLCGIVQLSAAIAAASIKQDTGVKSVFVGNDVTLLCLYESQAAMHFSWYRQTLEGRLELLSFFYKFNLEPEPIVGKNPRLSLQRDKGTNHLHISDAQLSDSATYFCGGSHSNRVEFGEGVFLNVQEKCDKDIQQEPTYVTVQPDGSVTSSCGLHTKPCGGELTVCWVRAGLLYAHCGPESGPIWIYHLQQGNVNFSDAGICACAASARTNITFQRETKSVIATKAEEEVDQITVFVWLSIARTAIVLLFLCCCCLIVSSRKKAKHDFKTKRSGN